VSDLDLDSPGLVALSGGSYSGAMDASVAQLSDSLFWDVDKASVDPGRNARWLVERVLERGRWEDWLVLRSLYGKERLSELSPTLRLDEKTAHFLALWCAS
jgi:hypothetical protein